MRDKLIFLDEIVLELEYTKLSENILAEMAIRVIDSRHEIIFIHEKTPNYA
jgi:hypothetical protein